MSRLLEMAEEKAHQRVVTVTTYKAGPGRAVVEGRLVDRRFKDNFLITGEKIPAGVFHDMIVRLLINMTGMIIEDVEVELVTIPRKECNEITGTLSVIKGVRITKGFTQKIKSLLGGIQSCSHLRELTEAIGPSVVQGVFSIMAGDASGMRALMHEPHVRKGFSDSVVDSCYVWRKDGPEYKKMQGLLKELIKES